MENSSGGEPDPSASGYTDTQVLLGVLLTRYELEAAGDSVDCKTGSEPSNASALSRLLVEPSVRSTALEEEFAGSKSKNAGKWCGEMVGEDSMEAPARWKAIRKSKAFPAWSWDP